jgi:hypothetical protein
MRTWKFGAVAFLLALTAPAWAQYDPNTEAVKGAIRTLDAVRAGNTGQATPQGLSPIPAVCFPPTVLPIGPSANAQAVTFRANWSRTDSMTLTLFREPCADPSQSLLYLRATPYTGVPFLCSVQLELIQGGSQEFLEISTTYGGNSFCDDLLVPTTFVVSPWSTFFSKQGAMTLVYEGVYENDSGALAAYMAPPTSIVPTEGMWWNPGESGSGYAIDVKHGVLVMTIYSYTSTGAPQWYLLVGTLVNDRTTAPLSKFQGGQCISCAYRLAVVAGDDGLATVTFTSATSATVTLPGGRITQIVPQNF